MSSRLLAIGLAFLLGGTAAAQDRLLFLVGAPVPGGTTNVRISNPAASAGNPYALLGSTHTDRTTTIPGIVGTLRIDPNSFLILATGTLSAAPTDYAIGLPNNNALLGLMADFQFVEGTGPLTILSDNEVVVTVVSSVGKSLIATGSTGNTLGWQFQSVEDATVGNPTNASSAKWDREAMRGGGVLGYGEGGFGGNGFTNHNAGPYVYKGDRVQRDLVDGTFGGWATQHGKRLRHMRDAGNPQTTFLALVDDATHTITQISGSVLQSNSTTTSVSAYGDYWNIENGGIIACGVADRGVNGDRIALVRLDGQTWNAATGSTLPGNGTSTLLLPTGATSLYDQNSYIGHEIAIQGGQASAANGGSARRSLWWAPLDGSAAPAEVVFPPLGGTRGNPNRIPNTSWRATKDLKTLAFVSYLTDQSNGDIYCATGVSKTGFNLKNVSGFTTATFVELWADERSAESTFSGALSDDGTYVAFLTGQQTTADPNLLYVAKTDGSQAGSLSPISGFPAGTTWMGGLQFQPKNGAFQPLFLFAGTAKDAMKMYFIPDVAATTPLALPVTTAADIEMHWSYASDNGRYIYFCRAVAPALGTRANIVGVDMSTSPPTLFDVTGTEFSSGIRDSLELEQRMYLNELRAAPNATNEIFFVARRERSVSGSTTTYYDENIYKFNMETGSVASQVTNYTGSATSLADVVHIENVRPLADGSVVYLASPGPRSVTAKPTVHWHKGDGTSAPVNLGEHAEGNFVSVGSVHVDEAAGRVYWVQKANENETAPAGHVAYMVFLDHSMKGHPIALSGLPIFGAGSSGNIIYVNR